MADLVTYQEFYDAINNEDFKLVLARDFSGNVDAARTAYFVELFMQKKIDHINSMLDQINFGLHDPDGVIQSLDNGLHHPDGICQTIDGKLDKIIKYFQIEDN